MSKRMHISSGTDWEQQVGYSRAVRVGDIIEVAGTTAVDYDRVIGEDDAYAQTKFIFSKIEKALTQCGASLNDVVRTRMYITDVKYWEAVGCAHGEYFAAIRPASTLLVVAALIDPRLLVEIEVTAIVSNDCE